MLKYETTGGLGLGESGDNADLGLAGEGDVVVDELTPGYQQDGDCVVVEPIVL